jgi:group II intron reverse transcriptase/maturase
MPAEGRRRGTSSALDEETSTERRGRGPMETKLARITEIAKAKPDEKFTSLAHLINEQTLAECHREMDPRKASGVDGVTKEEYEKDLQTNLRNLVALMKRQAYKPQPVRRKYIPKPGTDKKRPLGIPSYEDKLVQAALAKILNAIYEADFLRCSYGFRPGRGVHDGLRALTENIEKGKVNYIVDADIRGFFDHVDHEWLMKFVAHRIADPNILRLIDRFLRAGVIEAGIVYDTPEGTPQGGVVSPILANIYLHYVLDLWFERAVKRSCRGAAYMVRYADDFVCCFQHESEARAFLKAMQERLANFGLEIATEKTRVIAFGRNTGKANDEDGRKPETFDFLGFTHYCGTSRHGKFRVKRRTSKKKYRASLSRCNEWLRKNRNMKAVELIEALAKKLIGYYQFYGVTDNTVMLRRYRYQVERLTFYWLNRRSQRKSFRWEKFRLFLEKHPLPQPWICVNIYGPSQSYIRQW